MSYGINPFKDEVLCDVSPLDVYDVLLGQPYMWKRHVVYEFRPRSVIITLGDQLYRILKVVLTIVPPKKCRKVISHISKFSLFTIYSKGEQRNTTTTASSVQAPSIQQKKINKIEENRKHSFYTQSSHVAKLVTNVQPFQHEVLNNLPQAKQCNFSNKASSSPRFRFSKRFPLSPGKSTQWSPFLPKEGGLIQVNTSGYPPIPTFSKQSSKNLLFLAVFRFLNFWGHFEGLNEFFRDQ
jgi:hypothetical protein